MELVETAKNVGLIIIELVGRFLNDLGPYKPLGVVFVSVLGLVIVRAVLGDLFSLHIVLASIVRLIAAIFRFVFAPIIVVFRYRHWMRTFEERQGQLMRASHGAAFCLLAIVSGWSLLHTGNLSLPVMVILAVPVVWGAVVFFDGARRSRGEFHPYLAPRALGKATAGAVVLFLLPAGFWHYVTRAWSSMQRLSPLQLPSIDQIWTLGTALAFAAAWLIAFWCLVTGATKFLLLLRGWERRKAPDAPENPHGKSRVANAEESKLAFARPGRRSQMDGVKF